MISKIKKEASTFGLEVVANTNALLAYWDKNLICRFANQSYLEWFGVDPVNMIDKMHIKELLGPLYQKNLPFIKQVLQGKIQVFERDITVVSGDIRNSIATYYPDIKTNKKVEGFFVHVADVTPIKTKLKTDDFTADENLLPASDEKKIALAEKELRNSLLKGFPGIKNLSKNHFISETKLKEKFKERYGSTIFSYYRNLQMNLADHYLQRKGLSKKQVAALLHFSNPSNFSTCYKIYQQEKKVSKEILRVKEASNEQYATFIQQAPYAIAMLDEDLCFITASEKWIKDFYLPQKISGLKFNDLLPELNFYWSELLIKSLNGEIFKGEELVFLRFNDTSIWLKWDIRAWYTIDKKAGGVLIFTEDVTEIKSQAAENEKIFEILSKTSEIAKIGAWKRNFKTNTALWSKLTREILEVDDDYDYSSMDNNTLNFYKDGKDRELVKKSIQEAIHFGKAFDIQAHLVTAKGNTKKVRVIGYPVMKNGECEKLLGTFQEITRTDK